VEAAENTAPNNRYLIPVPKSPDQSPLPRSRKPCEPSSPIDVDDAQIEDPKDNAFKKPEENDGSGQLDKRDRFDKKSQESLDPSRYRG
jgi:hypothetical protein